MQWENCWCSTSDQQGQIGQRRKRDGPRENSHVILGSVTAMEGWMLGLARFVSKTRGKRVSEIPPENPWAQVLWRKTFLLRGHEAHRKSIQTTQLQLLIFKSPHFLSSSETLSPSSRNFFLKRNYIDFKRSETKAIRQEKEMNRKHVDWKDVNYLYSQRTWS